MTFKAQINSKLASCFWPTLNFIKFQIIGFILINSISSFGAKNDEELNLDIHQNFRQQTIRIQTVDEMNLVTPRSYVISLDLTVDENLEPHLLEFNNPPYMGGWSNYKIQDSNYLKSILFDYYSNFMEEGITLGSGSHGHDILFPDIPLNELIKISVVDWFLNFKSKFKSNLNMNFVKNWFSKVYGQDHVVYAGDPDSYPFAQIPKGTFILNHPAINGLVSFKSLQQFLSTDQGVGLKTVSFTRDDSESLYELLKTELDIKNDEEPIILKPSKGLQANGVMAVTLAEIKNRDSQFLSRLKKYDVWVAQNYRPGRPINYDDGTYELPVGRIFYHMIWDGYELTLSPLTAYYKLNNIKLNYNSNSGADSSDFSLSFGPIKDARKFTIRELQVILPKINAFFSREAPKMFYLSEHGFEGENPLAQQLRESLLNFPKQSQNALKKDIAKYTVDYHVEPTPTYIRILKSIKDFGIYYYQPDFEENPIYKSLHDQKGIEAHLRFCRQIFIK